MKKLFAALAFAIAFACCTGADVIDHVVAAHRGAGRYVALTFDDGPHPVYTPEILDILAEYGAKATFFVVGSNVQDYPELVKRAYDEGHEIGNHTFDHPDMTKLTTAKQIEQAEKTADTVENVTGVRPVLFRSPGGFYTEELVAELEKRSMIPVLWSWRQDTKDWQLPSADSIVKNVVKNLQDGDIILMHDYNKKGSPTPEALRKLLPILAEKGYTCLTVSALTALKKDTPAL